MGDRTGGGRTTTLREFRRNLYAVMRRRADALFELTDAILTAGHVLSPPHLSPAAVHRREWGSLYAELSKDGVDEGAPGASYAGASRPRHETRPEGMTRAVPRRTNLFRMDGATHDTTTTKASWPLLDGQLRLLEARRGDVDALLERGGGADDEAADALLNDLVGVRLVLRAVPLGGADAAGLPQEERRGLEGSERGARELFRRAAELAEARYLPP